MSKRYCRKLIRRYLRYSIKVVGINTAAFQLEKLDCECDWRP